MSSYSKRISEGCCGRCGKPGLVPKCDKCRERDKAAKRRQYRTNKSLGKCVECKRPLSDTETGPRCQKCKNYINRILAAYKDVPGVCAYGVCENKAEPNRRLCKEHLLLSTKLTKARQRRLANKKLCTNCGKPLDNYTKLCQRCKEFSKTKGKIRRDTQRLIVLNHYSNGAVECACCGASEKLFLTIDHIHGGGNQHYRADDLVRWLIKNDFPDGYQILCYNCNYGRWANSGICPHKQH